MGIKCTEPTALGDCCGYSMTGLKSGPTRLIEPTALAGGGIVIGVGKAGIDEKRIAMVKSRRDDRYCSNGF